MVFGASQSHPCPHTNTWEMFPVKGIIKPKCLRKVIVRTQLHTPEGAIHRSLMSPLYGHGRTINHPSLIGCLILLKQNVSNYYRNDPVRVQS